MIGVLPIPAAVVDQQGRVVSANRWIQATVGQALVTPADEEVAPGLRFGVDRTSRWRVRRLDDAGYLLLATAEREDAGDHLLRRFFASHDSLFVVYDQAGRVIESNQAWNQLLGYSSSDVFGLDSWTLLPPTDLETRARVEEDLRLMGHSEPRFQMRAANGTYRDIQWALHFDTNVGRCFGIGRDVTEELRAHDELRQRAYTDDLTQLANRAKLLEVLGGHLEGSGQPAVLFCDLDRFKVINDSLGHQAGDSLLADLGRRLKDLQQDGDVLVARIGGDEFVAVLASSDHGGATAVAEQILETLTEPFLLKGRSVHVAMSIGIAVATPGERVTAEELLAHADLAAYQAKKSDREGYVLFDERLRSAADRRFNVELGLRSALDDNRIEVHYQPIVRLPGSGIVGIEALVRWRTEDGWLRTPGHFLDVAEDAGMMPEIDHRVLRRAMIDGASVIRDGRPLFVSVNVSGAELTSTDYVERVLQLAQDTGFDPTNLVLEITESTFLLANSVRPTLEALREAGVRIALDDFGTGYSSIAHLRELSVDIVKVDRTFVQNLPSDQVTNSVTNALVQLCRILGLTVVMEGVETTDHASAAEQMGGELAQGYLFYRPMPYEQFVSLIRARATSTI